MKIYYKKREIDYERTLGELGPGEQVTVSTYDKDLANLRVAVMRAAKSFQDGRTFSVNKSINGAVISRTA
jgi:hypothetical protein